MRITLIALHFAEYSCRLAAALAKTHEVQLILSEPNVKAELDDEFEEFRRIPNLTIVLLPHRRSLALLLSNSVSIIRHVATFQPEVVHVQEVTKDYLVFALVALSVFYPIVLTVHDPLPHSGEDNNEISGSRHRYYHRLMRSLANRLITHGEYLRSQLEHTQKSLEGKVSVIPHGFLGASQPSGLAPEKNILLFFGRINLYKGLKYFVDAVLTLHRSGIEVRAVIAGRGGDLDNFRKEIESNSCFELHEGFVKRAAVHELFGRAQVIVMPYVEATQSGVAAMAIGNLRPVIATSVGAIPEMVTHGETGLLVPPRNSDALACAIQSLLENDQLYRNLSLGTVAARDGHLSWQSVAALTTDCYRGCLGGVGRGTI